MAGKKKAGLGPSVKHAFVQGADERSALALGSANWDLQQAAPLAMTTATLMDRGCAYPGCGKLRDDPIHEM